MSASACADGGADAEGFADALDIGGRDLMRTLSAGYFDGRSAGRRAVRRGAGRGGGALVLTGASTAMRGNDWPLARLRALAIRRAAMR